MSTTTTTTTTMRVPSVTRPGRGGRRAGAGRHRKDCACDKCQLRRLIREAEGRKEQEPMVADCLCTTQRQRDWLELWLPGGNASECTRELLDLAMRFWPAGPGTAPFTSYEKRLERWTELADSRGLQGDERDAFFARNVPGYTD